MILREAEQFVTRYNMISSGQKVVAAVSGGCDSVCMLHILSKLAGTIGFSLEAAHFNHKLRQEESERDEQFTKNLCEKLEIPLHVGAGDVSGYAARSAVGIEEAARILRYEFLEKISEETGADRIATAHNADDNAETVLFNLTRGSGIKGLCGIPPVRGKIIRPVMFLTRTRIEQYMEENGLDHVEDSTNADTDYTRNKLRHNVMPVLRRINPNVSGSIMDTKQLLTWDDEFISAFAQRFIDGNFNNGCVSAADIAGLHPAVAGRVVKMLCPHADFDHVKSVLELCRSEKASVSVSLPGMTVRKEYDTLSFGMQSDDDGINKHILPVGKRIIVPEINAAVRVFEAENSGKVYKTFNTFLFKKSSICGSIILRSRRTGDKINLSGCSKQLKKLFIEKRIPASRRQKIPVLADESGVIAVVGMGIDRRCMPQKGDAVIIIEFEELI